MNLSHKIVNMMFMLLETFNKIKYFKAMVTLLGLLEEVVCWPLQLSRAACRAHLPTSAAQVLIEWQPHLQEGNLKAAVVRFLSQTQRTGKVLL